MLIQEEVMKGEMYLTKPQQFLLVYSQGKSWVSGPVVVKILPNGLHFSRFGFSVGKRVGNAVTRNRIKRRLREILRKASFVEGWDIVIIARPSINGITYGRLQKIIEDLLHKVGLVKTSVRDTN
jgi:ribonuclease P protein component